MHINENTGCFWRLLRSLEQVLLLFFWILTLYGFDDPCIAGLTLISAVIHECGHIALPYLKYGVVTLPHSEMFGLRLGGRMSGYTDEFIFYSSGILFNFAASAVGALLTPVFGHYSLIFSAINLASGLANLLPVEGYDGYGILRTVLDIRYTGAMLYRLLDALSLSVSVFLTFLSLYLLYTLGEGYWIFTVFFFSTLKRCKKGLSSIKRQNSGEKQSFSEKK